MRPSSLIGLLLLQSVSAALLTHRSLAATRLSAVSTRHRAAVLALSGGAAAAPPSFSYDDKDDKCIVTMPIASDVDSKDVVFSLARGVLTLGVKGAALPIDGEALWGRVLSEEAFWEIDNVEEKGRCVVLELVKKDFGRWEYLLRSQYTPPDTIVTVRTYFDLAIDGEAAGRVELGLYGNQVRSPWISLDYP
jgi:hypothetical protein